jgi:hypothetical protein
MTGRVQGWRVTLPAMADNVRATFQALVISVLVVLAFVAVWDVAPTVVAAIGLAG